MHNEHDHIFGAYSSSISWTTKRALDPNAFMFLIRPKIKYYPLTKGNKGISTVWVDKDGIAFGGGADVFVDDCHSREENGCQSPITFDFDPIELSGRDKKDRSHFHLFKVKEYEVFAIHFTK